MSAVASTLPFMVCRVWVRRSRRSCVARFRPTPSQSRRSRARSAAGRCGHRSAPIGYVHMRSLDGRHVFDAYAHCRDTGGGRPRLSTFDTLNAVVAWMIQHEVEIRAFNARRDAEPEEWPAEQLRRGLGAGLP